MKVFISWSFMALCLTLPLAAESITYTMSGDISGTLGGVGFSDAAFTFVLDGEPTGVTSDGVGDLSNAATSNSISIAGFATDEFTGGIDAYATPLLGDAGILNSTESDGIVIANPGFVVWNLETSLGPLPDSGGVSIEGTLDTSLGVLSITGAENVSFGASTTTVPEPATIGLIALSLFGIALRRRWLRG
jgi:hypothetical protein